MKIDLIKNYNLISYYIVKKMEPAKYIDIDFLQYT